jgi:hypothetical protein
VGERQCPCPMLTAEAAYASMQMMLEHYCAKIDLSSHHMHLGLGYGRSIISRHSMGMLPPAGAQLLLTKFTC